jgi:hypothetical protein
MNNMRSLMCWFTAFAVVGLAGCATPGTDAISMNVEKSRTYNAPFDVVWPAIIGSVAEENLPGHHA